MSTKNVGLLLLAISFVILLGSCVSSVTPIQYAGSVPSDKKCTLKILNRLTVSKFDGEDVNWTAGNWDGWASVQIPEGNHAFVVNYYRDVSSANAFNPANRDNTTAHYRSGITFSYAKFVAGHTYELVAGEGAEPGGFSGLFTNTLGAMLATANKELRIGIRDITSGQKSDYEWLTPGHAGN